MKSSISNRVQGIISDVLGAPANQISITASSDSLEAWDSINHLNIVLALEQEFSVQFAPEEIEQLLSVDSILSMLQEKLR